MLGEDPRWQEDNPGHNGLTLSQIFMAHSKHYNTFLQKWEG